MVVTACYDELLHAFAADLNLPFVCMVAANGSRRMSLVQSESMSSNKEMAQKYKSAADYEDDFM